MHSSNHVYDRNPMAACSHRSFQRKILFVIGIIVGIFVTSVPIFNSGMDSGAAIVMFVAGLVTFVISLICLARECCCPRCCSQRNEIRVLTDVRHAAEEPPPPPYTPAVPSSTHTNFQQGYSNVPPATTSIIYPPPSYYDVNWNDKAPV